MSAECVLERTQELAEWSSRFILQRGNRAQRGELPCPESHSTRIQVFQLRAPHAAPCHQHALPSLPPSFNDVWTPSQKLSQWSPCRYFPFGLQVSEIPFLPGFRQFTLPFSKQIFILIKAFITIIHLSLQGIRQLQSTDWLSHHEPSPLLSAGGGAHINRTFH